MQGHVSDLPNNQNANIINIEILWLIARTKHIKLTTLQYLSWMGKSSLDCHGAVADGKNVYHYTNNAGFINVLKDPIEIKMLLREFEPMIAPWVFLKKASFAPHVGLIKLFRK
jgi:hypothetical protein